VQIRVQGQDGRKRRIASLGPGMSFGEMALLDGGKTDTIVEMAVVDPTAGGNPIPLTKEGSRKLFEAALSGKLEAARA
jgi:CRP-like cAMP-binding protein